MCGEKCKDGGGLGPKPWPVRRYALDGAMLLRFLSGEAVVVEHRALPPDATFLTSKTCGSEVELLVRSETFEAQTCQCMIPKLRVNYTTGG